MKILFFGFAVILFSNLGLAQSPDSIGLKAKNNFIEKMDKYLAIKVSIDNDFESFEVKSDPFSTEISPNVQHSLNLAFNYRFLSFSIGFTPKFFPGNNDDNLKGKTNASSYNLNLFFSHWLQGLTFNSVKGYYLANTSDFVPDWKEKRDGYIRFPDLIYHGFHGFTAYKFNSDFSFKALNDQTERQLKSSGSLIAGLNYNYYIVDDKTKLTGQNSSQKSNNLEVLISGGYFYTFVFENNFYASIGAIPGAGLIYTKLLTRVPEGNFRNSYSNPIYRLEIQTAIGYNSSRFFSGLQFSLSRSWYNENNTSTIIIDQQLAYHLFMGYRFDAPVFLKKIVDKTERLFSL